MVIMELILLGLTNHKNGTVSSKEIVATDSGAPVMYCNASLVELMIIPTLAMVGFSLTRLIHVIGLLTA